MRAGSELPDMIDRQLVMGAAIGDSQPAPFIAIAAAQLNSGLILNDLGAADAECHATGPLDSHAGSFGRRRWPIFDVKGEVAAAGQINSGRFVAISPMLFRAHG